MSIARAPVPAGPDRVTGPLPGGQLTIEIRTDFALPVADQAAIRALVRARPQVGIFSSHPWLSGLFLEPPAGLEPCLAIFREGGRLRGIVPLAVRYRLRQMQVTLLGGSAGSDRADLLAARGYEARCADALLWWLTEWSGSHGYVFHLRDVPHDSALWAAMGRCPGARTLVPREVHALPYLDLQEYQSEGCAGLPSAVALAKSMERHRRWLESRGRLRIEILRELPEVMAAFDTLVRLLHARWKDADQPSALDDEARHRFHRRTIPLLLDQGLLRMVRVSVDLRTVAVYYGLAVDRWWGYYLVGYDREWAKRIHLGRLTLGFAIDLAKQAGATEFDFLKGSEPVKYLWPVRERITMDADVYAPQSGAQLARATVAAREVGAALANSVLSLAPRE